MSTEFNIDFTAVNDDQITMNAPVEEIIQLNLLPGDVSHGRINSFLHQLSQVDIDNKFIDANYLENTAYSNVIIYVDNASYKLEFGVDYNIVSNQIIWSGYYAEELLQVNDKLKIYY